MHLANTTWSTIYTHYRLTVNHPHLIVSNKQEKKIATIRCSSSHNTLSVRQEQKASTKINRSAPVLRTSHYVGQSVGLSFFPLANIKHQPRTCITHTRGVSARNREKNRNEQARKTRPHPTRATQRLSIQHCRSWSRGPNDKEASIKPRHEMPVGSM